MTHRPVLYAPAWAAAPIEACGTCSNLPVGVVVHVAFCEIANARVNEYCDWRAGRGEKPSWVDDPEDAPGPDAMAMRYPAPKTDDMLW